MDANQTTIEVEKRRNLCGIEEVTLRIAKCVGGFYFTFYLTKEDAARLRDDLTSAMDKEEAKSND